MTLFRTLPIVQGKRDAPGKLQSTLSAIIAKRDWGAARKLLSANRNTVEEISTCCILGTSGSGGVLHFVCRFHPPLDVVQKIVESFPEYIDGIDRDSRLPLHIATRWGASSLVIKFLLQLSPNAEAVQDYLGKTPLILACQSYRRNFVPSIEDDKNSYPSTLKKSMLQIVQALYKTAPEVVSLEDEDGATALEYAIIVEADIRVVRLLHMASAKDWQIRGGNQKGGVHYATERILCEQQQKPTAIDGWMRRGGVFL